MSLPVKVIDGIAPMVLNVPAEARETHAHVQPGNLHGQGGGGGGGGEKREGVCDEEASISLICQGSLQNTRSLSVCKGWVTQYCEIV